MKVHPIAEKFPLMPEKEFAELKDSISRNGQRESITLLNGQILDGRHRYRACEELGIKPITREMNGGSPWQFVWDENAERRHIELGTKASLRLDFESGDAEWNAEKEKAAKLANAARSEASKGNQSASKSRSENGSSSSGTTTVSENKTRKARAKKAKVSPGLMAKAETVKKNAPDLHVLVTSGKLTLTQAYRQLRERKREAKRTANAEKVKGVKTVTEAIGEAVFSTIVIDPPWDWGDEGDVNQLGRAKIDFAGMPIEELEKLPVGKLADRDAHLYLWITNRSLPKGFRLLEAWGFRYVTCLTWCKPSIGIGNYFRGSTEQILFAVKGSLSLKRKNQGTWFEAKRPSKTHSSKPKEAFDIIESCSPGPYLEMFSRGERQGWKQWGEDSK